MNWATHQPAEAKIRMLDGYPDCIQPGQFWQHCDSGERYRVAHVDGDRVTVVDEWQRVRSAERWFVMRWWCYRVSYLPNYSEKAHGFSRGRYQSVNSVEPVSAEGLEQKAAKIAANKPSDFVLAYLESASWHALKTTKEKVSLHSNMSLHPMPCYSEEYPAEKPHIRINDVPEYNAYVIGILEPDDPDYTMVVCRAVLNGVELQIEIPPYLFPESERDYISEGACFYLPIDQIRFNRDRWTEEELSDSRQEAERLAKQLSGG